MTFVATELTIDEVTEILNRKIFLSPELKEIESIRKFEIEIKNLLGKDFSDTDKVALIINKLLHIAPPRAFMGFFGNAKSDLLLSIKLDLAERHFGLDRLQAQFLITDRNYGSRPSVSIVRNEFIKMADDEFNDSKSTPSDVDIRTKIMAEMVPIKQKYLRKNYPDGLLESAQFLSFDQVSRVSSKEKGPTAN